MNNLAISLVYGVRYFTMGFLPTNLFVQYVHFDSLMEGHLNISLNFDSRVDYVIGKYVAGNKK